MASPDTHPQSLSEPTPRQPSTPQVPHVVRTIIECLEGLESVADAAHRVDTAQPNLYTTQTLKESLKSIEYYQHIQQSLFGMLLGDRLQGARDIQALHDSVLPLPASGVSTTHPFINAQSGSRIEILAEAFQDGAHLYEHLIKQGQGASDPLALLESEPFKVLSPIHQNQLSHRFHRELPKERFQELQRVHTQLLDWFDRYPNIPELQVLKKQLGKTPSLEAPLEAILVALTQLPNAFARYESDIADLEEEAEWIKEALGSSIEQADFTLSASLAMGIFYGFQPTSPEKSEFEKLIELYSELTPEDIRARESQGIFNKMDLIKEHIDKCKHAAQEDSKSPDESTQRQANWRLIYLDMLQKEIGETNDFKETEVFKSLKKRLEEIKNTRIHLEKKFADLKQACKEIGGNTEGSPSKLLDRMMDIKKDDYPNAIGRALGALEEQGAKLDFSGRALYFQNQRRIYQSQLHDAAEALGKTPYVKKQYEAFIKELQTQFKTNPIEFKEAFLGHYGRFIEKCALELARTKNFPHLKELLQDPLKNKDILNRAFGGHPGFNAWLKAMSEREVDPRKVSELFKSKGNVPTLTATPIWEELGALSRLQAHISLVQQNLAWNALSDKRRCVILLNALHALDTLSPTLDNNDMASLRKMLVSTTFDDTLLSNNLTPHHATIRSLWDYLHVEQDSSLTGYLLQVVKVSFANLGATSSEKSSMEHSAFKAPLSYRSLPDKNAGVANPHEKGEQNRAVFSNSNKIKNG